jgi:hypothetical protein
MSWQYPKTLPEKQNGNIIGLKSAVIQHNKFMICINVSYRNIFYFSYRNSKIVIVTIFECGNVYLSNIKHDKFKFEDLQLMIK